MKNKEIELKYQVDYKKSDILLNEIMAYLQIPNLTEERMKAIYYDTLENDLLRNQVAFRIRKEGHDVYATIKAKGTYQNGIYSRPEWNRKISHHENLEIKEVFLKMECGQDFKHIMKDKVLVSRITTDFTRRKAALKLKDCLIELAFDKGEIITPNGKEDICELEVELLEGSSSCLEAFGETVAHRFDLKPEPMSKYARGLKLLQLI